MILGSASHYVGELQNSIPSFCFGYYQGFVDFLFHVLQSVTMIIVFGGLRVPASVSGSSFKLALCPFDAPPSVECFFAFQNSKMF